MHEEYCPDVARQIKIRSKRSVLLLNRRFAAYKSNNNKQMKGTLLTTCLLACSKFMVFITTTPVCLGKRTWQPWLRDGDRCDNDSYKEEATKRANMAFSLDELCVLKPSLESESLTETVLLVNLASYLVPKKCQVYIAQSFTQALSFSL